MRNGDLCQQLAWLHRDLAAGFIGRSDEEFVRRQFTSSLCRNKLDFRSQRDQRRTQAGGADEVRRSAVSEDGVVFIFAIRDQRTAVLVFAKQTESAAIVPATRALAQIAPNLPHMADRGAGHPLRALRK